MTTPEGIKIICQNKKARHNYFIEDSMEAGVVLKGSEVKSLREGKANLVDTYAMVEGGEAWMYNCHIDPYTPASQFNEHPMRKRKLLLHKKQISKLIGKTKEKGISLQTKMQTRRVPDRCFMHWFYILSVLSIMTVRRPFTHIGGGKWWQRRLTRDILVREVLAHLVPSPAFHFP